MIEVENLILELINVAGLPGVLLLAVAGVALLSSRSNVLKASASSEEAKAQASIAKDNADVVKRMAMRGEEEKTVLMTHVLRGQEQIVALTTLIGEVRLELSDRINLVTTENAKLTVEVSLRRESESFLKEGVLAGIQALSSRVEELINEQQSKSITTEITADRITIQNGSNENSQQKGDNIIGGSNESQSEVSVSGGGAATG